MLTALIGFVIVAFCLWLVLTYVPMPAPMKQILLVVIVIGLIVWLLQGFGLVHGFHWQGG